MVTLRLSTHTRIESAALSPHMDTILVIAGIAILMCLIERLWPANALPRVQNWWARVILTNTIQVAIVWLVGRIWDQLAADHDWRGILTSSPVWLQISGTYVLITLVYYFWHRLRHESRIFWRLCHQLHHSPRRMEVVMALYKHPVEITLNGLLSAVIVFPIAGCTPASAAMVTLITAVAEFFYHWNIRTPRWLGCIIQRPESHRVHHQKLHHTNNFSDLPLWDMLFGTYQNPRVSPKETGFDDWREDRFDDMLAFRDVHDADTEGTPPLHLLPTCIGCSKRWACHNSRAQAAGGKFSLS
jgi:sterol desaturase/sphingolipid hydroxylase (fatty acid hydroxylase superfamily)